MSDEHTAPGEGQDSRDSLKAKYDSIKVGGKLYNNYVGVAWGGALLRPLYGVSSCMATGIDCFLVYNLYNILSSCLLWKMIVSGKWFQILFSFLMMLHLEKVHVDEMLSPGLTVLRWTSLDTDSYVRSGHEALERTKLLISRVNNIHDLRIDQECTNVGATPLCELPDHDYGRVQEQGFRELHILCFQGVNKVVTTL